MDWDETTVVAEQATLALTGEGFGHAAETRGLLSLPHLLRHLPKTDGYASLRDAEPAYALAYGLWRKHAAALRKQGEALACSTFIEPLLDALGWHRIPQQSMPGHWATRKRPDYCLAPSESAFSAASVADGTELFQLSATVLEAKSWRLYGVEGNGPFDEF